MAGILGIKIFGVASEKGTLELLGKSRGKLTIYDKAIAEIFARNYQGGRIVISHCYGLNEATYIETTIKNKYPNCDIEIMATSGLCSYYAEQGGILIGFEG